MKYFVRQTHHQMTDYSDDWVDLRYHVTTKTTVDTVE